MELKAIERLLEKYLEAETSLKEEARLQAYFTSGNVAPHLLEYAPLFSYFGSAREEIFEGKVSYVSWGRKRVYSLVAVAASIVILMGVVVQQNNRVNEFGTYDDPELAMQKTKEALEMISTYMNTGTEDLGYLQEFNDTTNKITKNP
ncbi:hypothetical protein [Salinimicrobium flavum]|uniref:Uncharacterized protein n=1 Tax=Salinimicrobium flavum TaxID=1737065 RepID=A0ABW5J273_9FLAO